MRNIQKEMIHKIYENKSFIWRVDNWYKRGFSHKIDRVSEFLRREISG